MRLMLKKEIHLLGMRLAVESQAPKHICFTACFALAGLKEKEEECVLVCYLLALHAYSFLEQSTNHAPPI